MDDRTVMLVDGENVLLRYEEMMRGGRRPRETNQYSPSRFVWDERLVEVHHTTPYRVLYYTAAQGDDDRLEALRREIAEIRISTPTRAGKREPGSVTPMVFKKAKQSAKTKSVDINLTTDLLRMTYNRSVDRVIVLSGDGDYLPVYEEVMRKGVRVTVGSLSSGLNMQIVPVWISSGTSTSYFSNPDWPMGKGSGEGFRWLTPESGTPLRLLSLGIENRPKDADNLGV